MIWLSSLAILRAVSAGRARTTHVVIQSYSTWTRTVTKLDPAWGSYYLLHSSSYDVFTCRKPWDTNDGTRKALDLTTSRLSCAAMDMNMNQVLDLPKYSLWLYPAAFWYYLTPPGNTVPVRTSTQRISVSPPTCMHCMSRIPMTAVLLTLADVYWYQTCWAHTGFGLNASDYPWCCAKDVQIKHITGS